MSFNANARVELELWPWSSVALTVSWYRPSGSPAPGHWKVYVPGSRRPESSGRATPSGPSTAALIVEGRTTL